MATGQGRGNRGSGTGRSPGRQHGKTGANTLTSKSESVETTPDGEVKTTFAEYRNDPLARIEVEEPDCIEIDGCSAENNLLMYLDYESGRTYDEIAAKWRIKARDAQFRVESAHAEMVAECETGDISTLRRKQDMMLRRIQGIALREFTKSQGTRKSVTTKAGIVSGKETDVTEVKKEDSPPGDPRYLHVALTATEHLSKLWGIEAPKKVEHTGIAGGDLRVEVVHRRLQDADDDTLRQMADAWKAMKRLTDKPAIDAEFEVKQ